VKKGWVGQHTFKAGAQIQYLKHYQLVGTPGNSIYTDDTNQMVDGGVLVRDPTSTGRPAGCNVLQPSPMMGSAATPCFQMTYFEPPRAQVRVGWAVGGFVQDTWRPTSWLTIVPGLRVDYGTARNSLDEVVQNLLGFGPRLGVSVDLTRDGKTLLKFAYGRANEVSSLRTATLADVGASQSTWEWNRATGRFSKFFSSQGGDRGYDLRGQCADGTLHIDCGNGKLSLRPPHSDFVTMSLERELSRNVMVGITYTYRKLADLWEDIEVNANRTLDGGTYASFGDPRYGQVKAFRPSEVAFRRYNAIDFVLNGAPSPNWNFFVAYTLSFLDGTLDDQFSTLRDDPARDFRFYGYLSDDHRHQLKANGSYSWKGLSLGLNLVFLTGAPATRLYLQNIGYVGRYSWRGLDPNADPNDIRKWTELRSPDILDIGLRVQYDAHALIKQHLSFIVDLFNALDLSTAANQGGNTMNQAGFEARNAVSYGAATNRQVPFRVQFGLRYQY